MKSNNKIKSRERDAIINSLRSGVVPRIGIQHIQVGRLHEVKAINKDLEKTQNSGSIVKFVVGGFGSGKTFFLTLTNILSHNKNLVSAKADVTLEKTLYSRDGRARAIFSELISSLSIKQKPDGGALKYIIESWLSPFLELEKAQRKDAIKEALNPLKGYIAGYDFIEVLNTYVDAYEEGNDALLDSCLKWLRGEFRNITTAKQELPNIKSFISDENYYDYLKLYSAFFVVAGYGGLLVCIDELFNLIKQRSAVRQRNYETVLKIINDSVQGTNKGLMFVFGGTPDFVFCEQKGLYSYGALKTRLARSNFTSEKFKDFSGPLIELENLSPEEHLQLFRNIRQVFANYDESKYLVSNEELEKFLNLLYSDLGAKEHMTARDAIKSFVSILNILENNPEAKFSDLLNNPNSGEDPDEESNGDDSGGNTNIAL